SGTIRATTYTKRRQRRIQSGASGSSFPTWFWAAIGRSPRETVEKLLSTAPVEAELRITDQYLGAAKQRNSAINACGHSVRSGELGGEIISFAVLRIVKPAVGPMARTVGNRTKAVGVMPDRG